MKTLTLFFATFSCSQRLCTAELLQIHDVYCYKKDHNVFGIVIILREEKTHSLRYNGCKSQYEAEGQAVQQAQTCERNDEAYFEEIYEKYATDVLRVCYFYLGDRQKAEDVCQDVFVRLMTTTPDLQEGREKAWLLKVALNRCKDIWRSSWLKRVVLGSPAFDLIPAPDEIDKLTEQHELMSAVNQLPPTFKEVILLHYYQGFGITEIAEMMHLPEGTISSRLSRGRKRLETILKGGDAR